MEFRYLPMTETDKKTMLKEIGVADSQELFAHIPKGVRLNRELNLKKPANEYELKKELTQMAGQNVNTQTHTSFLGAGVYDHVIPSIVDHVISRSEFYTAYTPYQPEVSQGELQAIFEFQTMISELTGMPISNSSMYDGGTALAEGVNLSAAQTKRKKILVSEAIHPEYKDVINTYGKAPGLEIVNIRLKDGQTDMTQLEQELDENVASVVLQYPNFFGQIEPLKQVNEMMDEQDKAMLIVASNPLALGYLTPPGEFGADIVVGDTQVFGIPAQFGGPHCGYFATTKKLMRKTPGRLVGQTTDEEGVRGFVMTLQAREQHIRREKASSNICSNQALNALASSVAMSSIGKEGLKQMAQLNMQKARYAKTQFEEAGFETNFSGPIFNEFIVKLPGSVKEANQTLLKKGYIGGFDLGSTFENMQNHMLVAVTETRTKEDIDMFIKEMRDIYGK